MAGVKGVMNCDTPRVWLIACSFYASAPFMDLIYAARVRACSPPQMIDSISTTWAALPYPVSSHKGFIVWTRPERDCRD